MTEAIPDAVQTYLAAHTRKAGEFEYIVDETGHARFHSDQPGAPNWTPRDLAEWTKDHRPDLWGAETAKAAPAAATAPATVSEMMAQAKSDPVALANLTKMLGLR